MAVNGDNYAGWWLSPAPLKHMSSSVGMMTFPTEWENNPNVPNHQSVMISECKSYMNGQWTGY